MSELERLKADLEVLQKHQGYSIMENAIADIADKIARLEAEAADPWREHVAQLDYWRRKVDSKQAATEVIRVVEIYDHLTAEVDRLEKRVAESGDIVRRLAAYTNERQLFVLVEDAEKLWSEMQREAKGGK